jgi:hypothetical protein
MVSKPVPPYKTHYTNIYKKLLYISNNNKNHNKSTTPTTNPTPLKK